ncbi:hypothetical protein MMC30_001539 [Trapelia coarctata]|nr:hypothetical protein [Trapelia coarctata]
MPLMTLPVDVRNQILADLMHIKRYDENGETNLIPRESGRLCQNEGQPSSELFEAMPDLDVEALADEARKWQPIDKVRDLSLLYVFRQLYHETIPLFYEQNRFSFWEARDLVGFANRAWEMGNHGYRSSSICGTTTAGTQIVGRNGKTSWKMKSAD